MAVASVIVVEDEQDLRGSMCAFLGASGFDVRGVGDGTEFDDAWTARPSDIVVLDINLPGEDGFSIAARLRRRSPAGIIMLTARGQANDRITGLECGADNYLVKPVVLRELAAAVRGLARRVAPPGVGDENLPAAWIFDQLNWTLTAPNGASVMLTTAEFGLLSCLGATPGASVSSDEIMTALGKAAVETNRRSLDSLLSRLRRKVDDETGMVLPVRSVRSVGYVFASPLGKLPQR